MARPKLKSVEAQPVPNPIEKPKMPPEVAAQIALQEARKKRELDCAKAVDALLRQHNCQFAVQTMLSNSDKPVQFNVSIVAK